MPSNIPPHVQAWAKVHWNNPQDAWYDERTYFWITHGQPIPDAYSDAWLAGMMRAMSTHDGLEIEPPDEQGDWLCYWQKGFALRRRHGYAPTLEAAIISAVLGDDDAT